MRKFKITHPEFNGEAFVTYNVAGLLCEINMQETDMDMEARFFFKSKVAAHIDNIAAKFDKNTVIVEAAFEVSFDLFWSTYNKKINKARALALWKKLSQTKQLLAWQGVKAYDAYLARQDWRSKADPDTYLRNQYWDNEYK